MCVCGEKTITNDVEGVPIQSCAILIHTVVTTQMAQMRSGNTTGDFTASCKGNGRKKNQISLIV